MRFCAGRLVLRNFFFSFLTSFLFVVIDWLWFSLLWEKLSSGVREVREEGEVEALRVQGGV